MKSFSKKIAETFGAVNNDNATNINGVDLPFELDPFSNFEFISRMSDSKTKKFKHLSTRINKLGRHSVYLEHPFTKETLEYDERDIPSLFILKELNVCLDKFQGLEWDTGGTVTSNNLDDIEYDVITDDEGNIKKIPKPKTQISIQPILGNSDMVQNIQKQETVKYNYNIFSKLKKLEFHLNVNVKLNIPNLAIMKHLIDNLNDEEFDNNFIENAIEEFIDMTSVKNNIIYEILKKIKEQE